MRPNKNRSNDEYKGFNNWYLKECKFDGLTPEEHLSLGMVWQMTAKAQNQRTFERGTAVNSMTEMANQHKHRYNIKKKVTKPIWQGAMDDLIQKNWIHIVRKEKKPTGFKNKTKIVEHIQVTDYGVTMINRALKDLDNDGNVNKLF